MNSAYVDLGAGFQTSEIENMDQHLCNMQVERVWEVSSIYVGGKGKRLKTFRSFLGRFWGGAGKASGRFCEGFEDNL